MWDRKHEAYLKMIYDYCETLIDVYHKSFVNSKKSLCIYKLPTIFISASASFISVSNTGYFSTEQSKYISLAVGVLNLIVTIINTVESFKKINDKMVLNSKTYYQLNRLRDDISLTLSLPVSDRKQTGINACYDFYERFEIILEQATIPKTVPKNLLEIKKLITEEEKTEV